MELTTVWFIIIAFLFTGYFILEGFDFGVGILLPFLGKDDRQRRLMINSIGPHWDGNEVWLVAAGAGSFAAFPHWYATVFSGFYLPLFLILLTLIFRGVAFEFRGKQQNAAWKSVWDWSLFIGSLVPTILWGVAFANFVRGVPLDANMNYVGGFWNLLNGYALLSGLVFALLFTLHGAAFLSIKVEGILEGRAYGVMRKLWLPVLVALGAFMIASYSSTDFMGNFVNVIIILAAIAVVIATGWMIRIRKTGWVFGLTTLAILLFASFFFVGLYPRLLVSSTNPAWALTIENASSSPYTLKVMTIITATVLPIVLLYEGWSYWIFRKRLTGKVEELEY